MLIASVLPNCRFAAATSLKTSLKALSQQPLALVELDTKISYKALKMIDMEMLELNRNPQNYFAEIEPAAFSPSKVLPGIGFSPDKVLQARIMSYPDAQCDRIVANYQQVSVNQPKYPDLHYTERRRHDRAVSQSQNVPESATLLYPRTKADSLLE